ncbi:MAG TPA: hypothetical protein VFR84_10855 [Candidatus Angelobacter sp.]|nr:hypothetical protein [Candidatus Angelobacter sp.]
MRLVENLRKAERKGATAIRRGMERAREEWSDVERRLRQRMRIYPQKRQAMAAAAPRSGTQMELDETDQAASNAAGKLIISIDGRDVND